MQLPLCADTRQAPARLFGYPNGPRPRTVFLHGVLGSTAMWKAVASHESAPPSLALPLPGHFPWVLNGKETTAALDDFAFLDSCRRTIQAMAGDRVQLVAHSTGAMIALKFATLFPELVSRLVLVGSFPCGRAAVRRSTMALGVTLPLIGSSLFQALYHSWLHSPDTFALGLASAKAPSSGNENSPLTRYERAMLHDLRRSDPEALRQAVDWLGRTSIADDLSGIEAPVTVVVSQKDPVVDPASQLRMVSGLPHTNAVICRHGHLPMLEAPDFMRGLVFA